MLLFMVGLEALVIVLLLIALLYGQPAAMRYDRDRLNAQATQITLSNFPRPTPTPCPVIGQIRRC